MSAVECVGSRAKEKVRDRGYVSGSGVSSVSLFPPYERLNLPYVVMFLTN